ncbi:PA14 domain-containing protein [Actinomadura alba]|uniref:Glycoside hydrolase family 2 n=1 Tax=Actinomadura alba TaxID=406431 RepID=A0ABR7M0C0_9ACTN|nr:PA14 domain-containing protein [Actinomadura alba]MBC6470481.1 glycoside hydrolase family 2 [Actinomadura alba]
MKAKRRSPHVLLVLLITLAMQGVVVPAAVATAATKPTSPTTADGTERHGLRGDYHLSSGPGAFDFHELKATVLDPNIEFPDLEGTLRELTGRNDNVTVRWTGRIQPRFSEPYTFSMIGDNGFRLWVNDRLIIDNWVDNWDIEKIGEPIALQAGQKYDIKIEHFEHHGGSNLRLRWQSPSVPKEIVPAAAFTPPDGFVPAGPSTAAVAEAGDTVALGFDSALTPPPAGAREHLRLSVGGTAWPIAALSLASGDPSVLTLKLEHPIPRQAGSGIRISYDGAGGLTTHDGAAVEPFKHVAVANESTYSIKTRWAGKVDPARPLPDYPRPQLTRPKWQSLNGTWQFAAARAGEAPPVGRDLAERIVVPFPAESALSGIGRGEDRMWYRRTFTVPNGWRERGQRLLLHLDAVDWQSTVYVNGTRVTTHTGGYDRFSVDVTDALKPGVAQELIVGVYDPTDLGGQAVGKQRKTPGGIFYTPASGIWQSVWIEPVADTHVTGVRTTPDVADAALRVTVQAQSASGATAVVRARDGDRVVGTISGRPGTELRLPVPRPKLWSPEQPFLYDLDVTLVDADGRKLDKVGGYFGMRTVGVSQVDGVRRMTLNGKPVFQIGPLDQGFWPDGIYTAPTDSALRYDLEQTKLLGFNAVRKHVKVEPDRWYYWADRLGLLVWQDMPSMFSTPDSAERTQFETELRTLVDQHRSHPSIVMWVPFNEGWGQYDQARIADMVKQWDPSRLVNNMSGINCCGAVDGGNGDVMDFHIYPGPGTPGAPSATRASVLGEYGGLGLPVIGHTWSGGGWGYAVEPDPKALTDRYVLMNQRLRELRSCNGLSAAIYTQTTDVETELNGLMTYDREVTKPDAARVRAANQELIHGPAVACGTS